MGQIIMPRRRALFTGAGGGSGAGTWFSTWGEVTEDGAASRFVILAEGANAGDNDEGIGGGLANPNTVFTQAGNIAGAVGAGTGKYRLLDGADDSFNVTSTFTDLIKNQTKWQVLAKLSHIVNVAADMFWDWEAAVATNAKMVLRIAAGGGLELLYDENAIGGDTVNTANLITFASATPTWISVIADGTNLVRFFMHNSATRPTSWDMIAAGDKGTCITAGLNGTIASSFDGTRYFFDNGGGTRNMGCRFYYAIVTTGTTLFE